MLVVIRKVFPILVLMALLPTALPAQADPAPPMPPPAPTGLHAAFNNTTHDLILTWAMVPSNHTYSFLVYRNGDLLADQASQSYADSSYGSFNLYWIAARDGNSTSPPSEPVSFITCTSPAACAPTAPTQLAAWSSYHMVAINNGFAMCDVASVGINPIGYIIYWDCIRGILSAFHFIGRNCAVQFKVAASGPQAVILRGLAPWCI